MINVWVVSDFVNLVFYICKFLYLLYIYFFVFKDFLWKLENIGVLILCNGFLFYCISYCECGFDWFRDKFINLELNIYFVIF